MIPLLIAVLLLASIALASILYIGPRMLLMPDRRKPEFYSQRFDFIHPSQMELSYFERTLTTRDGYMLKYWVLDDQNHDKKRNIVIYLHGITDSKVSGLHYASELTRLCSKFYLIDMRRHGDSEGEYCTYGYHEKHDVVALIDSIKQEYPDTEVTLLGVSMGAAIAIQTAAMDKRVSRVIAVAPFYDLHSIVLDHQIRRIGIKSKLLLRLVLRRAEKIANFKAADVSPANDIGKIKVPILIIRGENDKTVKRIYPERLRELSMNAELVTVPGAGHVDVLEKGGKEYLEKLSNFLKEV